MAELRAPKGANKKNKYNSNFDLFSLNEVIIYKRNKNSLLILTIGLLKNY